MITDNNACANACRVGLDFADFERRDVTRVSILRRSVPMVKNRFMKLYDCQYVVVIRPQSTAPLTNDLVLAID